MTRKEIKKRVIEIVSNKIGFDQNEICESTRFIEDLGTDSLDVVELLMEFERAFKIVIHDEEMFKIVKVGDVIDGLCQRLGVTNTIKSIDRNAPDKIYILHHEDYSDRKILNAFIEKEEDTDIEYIRKDSLLEWLKIAVENYSHPDTVNVVDTIRCEGKKLAFQDVINKIESL